ncbi:hypothetical protein FHW83_005920 [Duganella sp. SG902]|uniref:toprim domain-containing protein n=1 Tax=Duganella sp. SG902 TaxID=2587016 RepID=UPI00159E464E|nr:toprim domain-containing protein [Duganella sp. SG902]NVM80075.1 hypothetical protein [Duganella sp. SG902]
MASIDELKRLIDLRDLADRLGMKQGKGGDDALYHSPHHPDKNPSLSIFVNHPKHGTGWKDWSADEGGSCVDLVMYVNGCTLSEAMRWLHETYAIPFSTPDRKDQPKEPKSRAEYIADKALAEKENCRAYLNGRGISNDAINAAFRANTLGYNAYTSPSKAPGSVGHGGPGVAFIVHAPGTRRVVAVDMRYFDAELNGGVKTQCQGEKDGYGWTSDPRKLERAETVYIVESPINVLSIDTCNKPRAAAFAIRGIANLGLIDWTFLRGKQVIICLDNDQPFPEGHHRAGHRPGPEAMWDLYDVLTALNISALLVDQAAWEDDKGEPINDVNDYLQAYDAPKLAKALDELEPWLIPGLPGDAGVQGKKRMHLPSHDFAQYWRYRVRPDFTYYIKRKESGDDDDAPLHEDLCGFRVASLSRVKVASATSTMTGDVDSSPTVFFSVTVQTAHNGAELVRDVMTAKQLNNLAQWGQFGAIYEPKRFSRMLNIVARTAHLGARNAANFVGLAWLDGRLAVNEGPDCYFTAPEQQCPYSNLTFPSGPQQDAAKVIRAYQATFLNNAAALPLVWGLGGHLKAILGFWPHLTIQADKGAGKTTLTKAMERTLAMTMFSGQSLETDYRQLTTLSHTSHPVGWEELSARRQDVIDKAVGLLQEAYQYTVTKRGAAMTQYMPSAPVLLAGEDVPVRSLLGKLVRTDLNGRKGVKLPADLPRFPLRQWLQFLAELNKSEVLAKYDKIQAYVMRHSRGAEGDDGATRMAGNYAAILLAWSYLTEFAGMDWQEGDFEKNVVAEMNLHISESTQDRSPWVWIMETVLSEMDAGRFHHPNRFDKVDGEACLLIRPAHIIDHLATSTHLREKWNGLPVKSANVFKKQLRQAGVIQGDTEAERTIGGKRVSHLVPLNLAALAKFGLAVAVRDDPTKD